MKQVVWPSFGKARKGKGPATKKKRAEAKARRDRLVGAEWAAVQSHAQAGQRPT